MTEPTGEAEVPEKSKEELGAEELEQVNGGVGLLVPAVQKIREAAAKPSKGLPLEEISMNYSKL